MDVSKFQIEGEWLELEIESEKVPEPVKFRIKPLSAIEQIEYGEIAREDRDKYFKKLFDLILDWNLTENGNKLDCNQKNRELYMKFLLPLDLKVKKEEPKEVLADEDKDKEEEEDPKKKIKPTVGLVIYEFACDFTNFIKN